MRVFSIVRVIALAAAMVVPVAHAALADAPQTQPGASLSSSANAGDPPAAVGGGPYDNDFVMAPPLGN